MKRAFTMSEILITITIIGVVAALTLPILIQNHKRKVLENAFLKSTSAISSAIRIAIQEYGIDNADNLSDEEFTNSVLPLFIKRLNIADTVDVVKRSTMYSKNTNKGAVNFTNTSGGNMCFQPDTGTYTVYVLSSGEFLCYRHLGGWNNVNVALDIDTNGYKGPNRLGYDIFEFKVTNTLEGYINGNDKRYCTTAGAYKDHQSNGRHCGYFAIRDINPEDNTKPYWKTLQF